LRAVFSILIPSWNNLAYLRLCVESLRRHSARPHQIVVHANEGTDGTREWLRQKDIEYTASERNIGICYAVNLAATLAKAEHVLYLNDDMVAAPGWDLALEQALDRVQRHGMYMLSGTMVEPVETGNRCVVVADYGREPARFDMARFVAHSRSLARSDWLGATWPPTLVPRELWHRVGGYSIEYSPGMSSDNDLSMKLWHAGCRVFFGVGTSLFYHFAKATTARIRKNDGRRLFLMKWGMTQSTFDRYYLRRGEPMTEQTADRPPADPESSWSLKWQAIKAAVRRRL
jgi:GT2 family glycosyltransferase